MNTNNALRGGSGINDAACTRVAYRGSSSPGYSNDNIGFRLVRQTGSGFYRVVRGGSWNASADFVRVAYRHIYYPYYSSCHIGFRLVRRLHE